MALQRDARYPGRWTAASGGHPQGAFKNRTAPGALDGSYIEQDWANDWDGYFGSLLGAAGLTADGNVDAVGASQYFTALKTLMLLSSHGKCRLSVASTTSLELKPYNGTSVVVNGEVLQLPAAGITVSNSGLAASTLYYVYLSGTTSAPVLSLSVTGHSQATNGVETKTGDTASTLVGMAYTNASTQFVDSAASRTCLNWFNRRKIIAVTAVTGPFAFTNTTLAETSTTIRASFLNWTDDVPVFQMSAQFTETSGSPAITRLNFQLFADGIVNGYSPAVSQFVQPTYNVAINAHGALGLTEGYHFATLGTYVGPNGGTLSIDNIQTSVSILG